MGATAVINLQRGVSRGEGQQQQTQQMASMTGAAADRNFSRQSQQQTASMTSAQGLPPMLGIGQSSQYPGGGPMPFNTGPSPGALQQQQVSRQLQQQQVSRQSQQASMAAPLQPPYQTQQSY